MLANATGPRIWQVETLPARPGPYFMAIIQTVYYDEHGRKVGESVESDADRLSAARERRFVTHQVTPDEVYLQDKGTQRRPARHDVRFR